LRGAFINAETPSYIIRFTIAEDGASVPGFSRATISFYVTRSPFIFGREVVRAAILDNTRPAPTRAQGQRKCVQAAESSHDTASAKRNVCNRVANYRADRNVGRYMSSLSRRIIRSVLNSRIRIFEFSPRQGRAWLRSFEVCATAFAHRRRT